MGIFSYFRLLRQESNTICVSRFQNCTHQKLALVRFHSIILSFNHWYSEEWRKKFKSSLKDRSKNTTSFKGTKNYTRVHRRTSKSLLSLDLAHDSNYTPKDISQKVNMMDMTKINDDQNKSTNEVDSVNFNTEMVQMDHSQLVNELK